MPQLARALPSTLRISFFLTGLLTLSACQSKDRGLTIPGALEDAALPMSPAPGDLLPATLPGFSIELAPATSKQDSLRDNLVALVRSEGQTDTEPSITLALGRVDGATIKGQWQEMYLGFQRPALKLTEKIHGFTLHQRSVRAGDIKVPEEHGGSRSLLWFRFYRDVPVMVFASDEATGKRFIEALCTHWEGASSAPQAQTNVP